MNNPETVWPMNLTVEERRESMAQVAEDNPERFGKDSAAWFRSACLEEHDPGYMCLRPKGHPQAMNNPEMPMQYATEGSEQYIHRLALYAMALESRLESLTTRLREVEEALEDPELVTAWSSSPHYVIGYEDGAKAVRHAIREALSTERTPT